jgi:hypothetical protein
MTARQAALFGLLTSLSLASACAGDLKSPNRFSKLLGASDASVQQQSDAAMNATHDAGVTPVPACVAQAFRNSCGSVACHSKGAQQVDLLSEGVAGRLIDKPARNIICKGRTLVATDGSASLLVQKLTQKQPPCGVMMPASGTISAQDKQCVFDWVVSVGGSVPDAGAP